MEKGLQAASVPIITDKVWSVKKEPGTLPSVLESFEPFFTTKVLPEDYHSDRSTISSTGIKLALTQSFRAFYYDRILGMSVKEESEEMKFGSLFHEAVLEPMLFAQKYYRLPVFGDMRKVANKAELNKFLETAPKDALPIAAESYDTIQAMIKSLKNHKTAARILEEGIAETVGYARDQETGLMVRVKPDFIQTKLMALSDLKTTRDAKRNGFLRQVEENYLYVQLAMYVKVVEEIMGQEVRFANFVAIEKKPPYEVGVWCIDEGTLDAGLQLFQAVLRRIKKCMDTNYWPPYQTVAQNLGLSSWAFERVANILEFLENS